MATGTRNSTAMADDIATTLQTKHKHWTVIADCWNGNEKSGITIILANGQRFRVSVSHMDEEIDYGRRRRDLARVS